MTAKQSPKRATLADVARLAGVSPITVSRSINYPDKVSKKVRVKIDEAIDTLGYIPNQSASALASSKSGVIAVIIPSLSNIVFSDVVNGIYAVAGASGYKVLLANSHYSPLEEENLVRTLLSQSPEAMIITGGGQTSTTQKLLHNAAIPIIQMMEYLENPLDMNIGFSHYQAAQAVATMLLEDGHQNIAFIGARMDARTQQRLQGFKSVLEEAGRFNPKYVITTPKPSSISRGSELFQSLISSTQGEVEAVFCCNDDLALGALFEAQRMHISIPHQMAICGFNDIEAASCVNPPLTSVHAPRYEMGAKATEMIIGRLRGESPEKQIDLGFEISYRESTKKRGG